jgi:hypothetical protein
MFYRQHYAVSGTGYAGKPAGVQGTGSSDTVILPELLFEGNSLAIFVAAMGLLPTLRLLIRFCF